MAAPESKIRETAPYQLFMLVLSVYVLIELALESVLHIDGRALAILLWADTLICGVFFVDFLRSLKRAPNKGVATTTELRADPLSWWSRIPCTKFSVCSSMRLS